MPLNAKYVGITLSPHAYRGDALRSVPRLAIDIIESIHERAQVAPILETIGQVGQVASCLLMNKENHNLTFAQGTFGVIIVECLRRNGGGFVP